MMFDPDIPEARVEGGDTLIDTFRRMITDVRIAGYEPNAGVVHPLDWEEIILEKGSDNRYIWVIVTDGNVQRLWGVPVIETIAVEGFEGDTVEQRNMVVGDWRRGATLWDREQSSIQVGWINDQFIKNQRTILAELRAAFAVRRPKAFVKHQTQAEVS
jgi:HK97 family phage major capsid protein